MDEEIKNKFLTWLDFLNKRQEAQLVIDMKTYELDWTEEVIIPEKIYELFPCKEKKTWNECDLNQIYSPIDIKEIFGVQPFELNKCFSKRFYKLSKDELLAWNKIGKFLKTSLPIDQVYVIYSQ